MKIIHKRLIKAMIGGGITAFSIVFGYALLIKEIEAVPSIISLWALSFIAGLFFLFEAFKRLYIYS